MRVSHYAVCTDYAVPNLKKEKKELWRVLCRVT